MRFGKADGAHKQAYSPQAGFNPTILGFNREGRNRPKRAARLASRLQSHGVFYAVRGGREPGVVVRAMGMPSGKAVAPLDRERRLPISTNAVRPPIAPHHGSPWPENRNRRPIP